MILSHTRFYDQVYAYNPNWTINRLDQAKIDSGSYPPHSPPYDSKILPNVVIYNGNISTSFKFRVDPESNGYTFYFLNISTIGITVNLETGQYGTVGNDSPIAWGYGRMYIAQFLPALYWFPIQ